MRAAGEILDILRVPTGGDPQVAVRTVRIPRGVAEDACDVLVIGAGTGGISAAIAASRWGARVCVLEETSWIGGQFTSQGVSALDEHPLIERSGATRSYYALRRGIRAHYQGRAHRLAADREANPGNCWVSRLAFEPRVALGVLEAMCREAAREAGITVHLRRKAVLAELRGTKVDSVLSFGLESGTYLRHRFKYVIDATELGDILPMAGIEYVVGAESRVDTGEPHAPSGDPLPDAIQSLTYPAVVTRARSATPRLARPPERYELNRDSQPYSLRIHVTGGEIYGNETGWLQYSVFETLAGTKGSLWSYRRLLDADHFDDLAGDVSILNWPGNDYRGGHLIDHPASEQAVALQEAKLVSLGFVHWLRSEAPREGQSSAGYPEIVLKPDVYGTQDGVSMFPYIRESRRIRAIQTVREQDVAADCQLGPRAAPCPQSVGIGWYPIDIHASRAADPGVSARTRPFQIPIGSLVPRQRTNLLAGAKNIGTSHITNGCFRVHPVEWNIGESAGALAAYAVVSGREPWETAQDPALLRDFQARLIGAGVPVYWYADVGPDSPEFSELQLASLDGHVDASDTLHGCRLRPDTRRDLRLTACRAPELLSVVP